MSGKRRIFFERDAAGLSNGRLQLESLLTVAAITGRQLVLPPPSSVHHLSKPFHESDVWSMSDLCRHVDLALQQDQQEARQADRLQVPLADVTFDAEGKPSANSGLGAGDWLFPMGHSRIQHFECLRLATPEQRQKAAQVVRDSLDLDRRYHAGARRTLRRLGLTPGQYVAVHIRRGDFAAFRPSTQTSGQSLAATSQGLCQAGGVPLVLASDASARDVVFREFAGACSVLVKVTSEAFDEDDDDLTRAAIDLLVCAWAKTFVGTPESTFSTTIMGLRARANLADASVDATPRFLLDGKINLTERTGMCWSKPTSYDAIRHPEALAPSSSPIGWDF